MWWTELLLTFLAVFCGISLAYWLGHQVATGLGHLLRRVVRWSRGAGS